MYSRIWTCSLPIQSFLDMKPRLCLCVKINFETQAESMAVPLSNWTEAAFLHQCTYSPSVLSTGSKPAQKNSQNGPFHTCSPRCTKVLNKEPCCQGMHLQRALPIVLASDCADAPSVTYESHRDSYTYIHRLLHHRGRLYCPILRYLDEPHCDDCYSPCVSLCTLTVWITCMFDTVKAWCVFTLASETLHRKASSVCALNKT